MRGLEERRGNGPENKSERGSRVTGRGEGAVGADGRGPTGGVCITALGRGMATVERN